MTRPTNTRRAIDAARAIACAKKGDPARPLAYVEAVGLEGNPAFREGLVQKAAAVLAAWPDAEDAAREIAAAYFGKPPRPDTTPDKPGEAMRRQSCAKLTDPAPAPAPGAVEPAEPAGPLPRRVDDDRRSVEELDTAGRVLVEATLRNVRLRHVAQEIGLRVRLLSTRMREDKSGAIRLRAIADRLRDAAAAAGTQAEQTAPDEERIRAIARGEGVDAINARARFAHEFDTLAATGHGPSMGRERFVALSMERWNRNNQ